MKSRHSPIHWILILALVSHGALPGVVVCIEPAGQVKVENIADDCCYGGTNTSDRTADTLLKTSPGSVPAGSCGPCSDTPISPNPVTKPSRNGDVSVSALPSTTLALDPSAIGMESYAANLSDTTDAALVLIKTTTLLI